jgi:GAF domain-containing protein
MEALPETRAALAKLQDGLEDNPDPASQIVGIGEVITAAVPSCVGVSLTVIYDGEALTFTATSSPAAMADAGQYLDEAGPCLDASQGEVVTVADVLDEQQWESFSLASAAAGIRSSMSVPLRGEDGRIAGALNMYAEEPSAFDGHEAQLATAVGATASEVVKNADLAFRSRQWARETPNKLQGKQNIEMAVGILMESRGWGATQARQRIISAAHRAGIAADAVAAVVLGLAS